MYQNFLVDRNDKIVVVTLNRPEKRNPINEEMLSEFEEIVMSLRDDASSRAVILTGTGNSFCAGADLSMVKGVTDPADSGAPTSGIWVTTHEKYEYDRLVWPSESVDSS